MSERGLCLRAMLAVYRGQREVYPDLLAAIPEPILAFWQGEGLSGESDDHQLRHWACSRLTEQGVRAWVYRGGLEVRAFGLGLRWHPGRFVTQLHMHVFEYDGALLKDLDERALGGLMTADLTSAVGGKCRWLEGVGPVWIHEERRK